MIVRHARGKITWVDIESPTPEELRTITQEFGIDMRIEGESTNPTPYPILVPFPDYVYLILHFPTSDRSGGARDQEIDFIIGKQFLITVRYEAVDAIHGLHKVFEAEELLGLPKDETTTDSTLERVFRRLYGAIREEAGSAAHTLERIEADIFAGKEREMVRSISDIGRVLLRFDTTLTRHGELLASFLTELSDKRFFGPTFKMNARRIEAEREHVSTLISSYREVANELRTTNDSMLSAAQNEVMKTLTVVTFIVLPLSLIAALFQMNVSDTPLASSPHAFWFVITLMVIVSGLLALFVIKKRWL